MSLNQFTQVSSSFTHFQAINEAGVLCHVVGGWLRQVCAQHANLHTQAELGTAWISVNRIDELAQRTQGCSCLAEVKAPRAVTAWVQVNQLQLRTRLFLRTS